MNFLCTVFGTALLMFQRRPDIQRHGVTESGAKLNFDPVTATTLPLSLALFALVTYTEELTGGTGRFAGAKRDMEGIGEVDLVNGTVFQCGGQVCNVDKG